MSLPRFDHIAMALHRMADATPVLVGELGGVPHHGGPSGPYRFGQWSYAGGGRLEVLEPLGPDGFLHRFLAQRGPGVHHVTFVVPDLDAACARARAHGYRIVGYDGSDPSWREAFLHPKEAQGIVVQFAESHEGAGGPEAWEPPPAPPAAPAVRVLGLRVRVRSRARALTQWGVVLAGEASETGPEELTFRWPESPMRLVATVDAAADEGPMAIEYASDRQDALPDGPHPVLGVVLRRVPA
jgi:methylmalonyl-CoA/ethylmalonyl-CoA epimerase